MSFPLHSIFGHLAFGVLAASAISQPAMADANGRMVTLLPKYQQECAACHIAYSPALMPAASWRRIMSNLPNHFGTDASLDPATLKELSGWINSHAGTYKRVSEEPPQDRITRTAWFVRKHDEVSAASWKLPAVKSASNCIACHTAAEKGDFNEHNVRIPR
ncbi:MAG: diheme cytochrome c [Polaromonas sp.]|nr:diheme cytochrome c [Polaromonas sp.]